MLRTCGCFTLGELGIEHEVARGERDIALADLNLDSLARMEFCISIENAYGLSVSPEDLDSIGTIGDLEARVNALRNRS